MATQLAQPQQEGDACDAGAESDNGDPHQELAAAVIFILTGAGAFAIALDYPVGTLRRMGPGFFPLLVSGLLIAIGTVMALQPLLSGFRRFAFGMAAAMNLRFSAIRALFFIMLSLLAFAALIRPAGMFIATAVQAFIATRAEPGRKILGSLLLALALSCVAAAIFIYGIGLPIPLWP